MYRVDTKPRNAGRGGQNFERKKKLPGRGKAFRRILEGQSEFDEDANTITYLHATKGYRTRFLTPQLAATLLGQS